MATIRELIANKSASEKATIKGVEISKIDSVGKKNNNKYGIEVEIISVTPTERGVEVLAKGWKQGEQLGFGKDGSVEIERFKLNNPPVLVEDPTGDIIQNTEAVTGEGEAEIRIPQTRILKEDPEEAIRTSVAHTMKLVGKTGTQIEEGKIGNTVTTYHPAAGATEPVDGSLTEAANSPDTWANVRGSTGTNNTDVSGSTIWSPLLRCFTDQLWRNTARSVFLFDTSDLGTDTIDSAVFSVHGTGTKSDTNTGNFTHEAAVVGPVIDSTSNLSTTLDYQAFTTDTTKLAANKAWSALSTSDYTDFTLNASGESNINKTGISYFGMMQEDDRADTEPTTTTSDQLAGYQVYTADQTGTAEDPKLVVTHSASFTPKVIIY